MRMRDELDEPFADAEFVEAFGRRGRRGWSPGRLAMVTVLQMAENLSDRAAVQRPVTCQPSRSSTRVAAAGYWAEAHRPAQLSAAANLCRGAGQAMLRAAVHLAELAIPPWPDRTAPVEQWRAWLSSIWSDNAFSTDGDRCRPRPRRAGAGRHRRPRAAVTPDSPGCSGHGPLRNPAPKGLQREGKRAAGCRPVCSIAPSGCSAANWETSSGGCPRPPGRG
ncbi:hypothetical protein DKG34_21405 [Streptomyces sp. NWU49]|nr:hypothetical protein DKG34_21405 [Streptomyces sp. NWU49]